MDKLTAEIIIKFASFIFILYVIINYRKFINIFNNVRTKIRMKEFADRDKYMEEVNKLTKV